MTPTPLPEPDSDPTPPSGTERAPPPTALQLLVENREWARETREEIAALAALAGKILVGQRALEQRVSDGDQGWERRHGHLAGALRTVQAAQVDLRTEARSQHTANALQHDQHRRAFADIYERLGIAARDSGARARVDSLHDEHFAVHDKALATRRVIAGGVAGGLLLAMGAALEKFRVLLGLGK